jgi:hypothetical protein
MKHLALLVLILTSGFRFAAAQVPSEEIFNSGLESGIALEGTAGYPGPLANATVELHLGNYVATTATKADGTYRLQVESRYLGPTLIAELMVYGHGTDSKLAWASPLGPSDRLLTLASSGTLTFADEPFLNLNPLTTALAAALRAYNGFAPISDRTTFYKAARSYQLTTVDLAYALALVARGNQALPSGAANTFAAVATLPLAQRLYAREQTLADVDCPTTPAAPVCVVAATLLIDPAIVPTRPWITNSLYAHVDGFDYPLEQQTGVRPQGSKADMFGYAATPFQADVSAQADGSYTLTRAGNLPFYSLDFYPLIGSTQVHEHIDVFTIHVRVTPGPGGQSNVLTADDQTKTYPENPEITPQPVIVPGVFGLPVYAGIDPLPAELLALVPDVTNRSFVLTSPLALPFLDTGFDSLYGYDVYNFTTGQTERQGKAFTFSGAGTPVFSLNFSSDATIADVQFIDEESPGIWRVRTHATTTAPAAEQILDGLMMETINVTGGFTANNLPGSYEATINGFLCEGPLGGVASNNPICAPPFGWIFGSAATPTVDRFDTPGWGVWQLPGGVDSGRVLFAEPSFVATPIIQERGWELVRSDGANDMWVLENVTLSPGGSTTAPPVSFIPTYRLTHVVKQ